MMKMIELKDLTPASFRLALEEATGAGPDEEINIQFPKFDRAEPIEIDYRPTTREEFDSLKYLAPEILHQMGFRLWEEGHYLYPWEWYGSIPDGYPIVSIMGRTKNFRIGVTDNDKRFGCLSFGFLLP